MSKDVSCGQKTTASSITLTRCRHEEAINNPGGYKDTVEKLTRSVYEWEQGQMKLAEENARLREAVEEHCHRWETWANAYPEDIFEPLSKEEIKQYSNIITRNSAAMGRHILKNVKEDIANLRRRAGMEGK